MTDYASYWAPQSIEEAQYWIDTGNSGEAFWAWGERQAAQLCEYMTSAPLLTVDYGCGVGRVLRCMPGARRVGVDVSEEMLALARENAPDCEFIKGDGRSIPLENDSATFIYSLLTLQHMDGADSLSVVRDAWRVLRRGSSCFLQFSRFGRTRWTPDAVVQRGESSWTGQRSGSWCGAHGALCYESADIELIADMAGFQNYRIKEFTFDPEHPYWALVATK